MSDNSEEKQLLKQEREVVPSEIEHQPKLSNDEDQAAPFKAVVAHSTPLHSTNRELYASDGSSIGIEKFSEQQVPVLVEQLDRHYHHYDYPCPVKVNKEVQKCVLRIVSSVEMSALNQDQDQDETDDKEEKKTVSAEKSTPDVDEEMVFYSIANAMNTTAPLSQTAETNDSVFESVFETDEEPTAAEHRSTTRSRLSRLARTIKQILICNCCIGSQPSQKQKE